MTLATLKDGDAFGEEALLSSAKRNATVTAETDALLMRLSQDDFNELLKAPMLNEVDLGEAKQMVQAGAVLMDVRMESEHKAGSIKGSVNIPVVHASLEGGESRFEQALHLLLRDRAPQPGCRLSDERSGLRELHPQGWTASALSEPDWLARGERGRACRLAGRGAGHPDSPPFRTHRAQLRQWAQDKGIRAAVRHQNNRW